MCKVSIIIPVYNIPEQNLRKCIESVINQTLEEIEIILVDDGSTDSSGIICDEYATIDNRVKVIHKLNCGLSAARNTGFENAKGEWITFLDSDDWIEPHTCEETYKLGIENDVDIVIFSTIQEFGKFKKIFKYKLNEYSCAAEPPVQYRLSHLSRRSEPLINHTICYDASLLA